MLERGWASEWLAEGRARVDSGGEALRIIEIGCGPALVSLFLNTLLRGLCSGGCVAAVPPCAVLLDTTDISPDAIDRARTQLRANTSNDDPLDSSPTQQPLRPYAPVHAVSTFTLDFGHIPEALCGTYDVILASDIVYDFQIAKLVPPALVQLLKPAGRAILCCESIRDGMADFVRDVQESFGSLLRCVSVEPRALVSSRLPARVNPNCTLMIFERISS
mmetsp:Transcript_17183/g.19589  ORF Transcript_17183/g.19589 Transcript_17183/m.19589 type:complete len:219 (-) Transcript_17183:193-849(-)